MNARPCLARMLLVGAARAGESGRSTRRAATARAHTPSSCCCAPPPPLWGGVWGAVPGSRLDRLRAVASGWWLELAVGTHAHTSDGARGADGGVRASLSRASLAAPASGPLLPMDRPPQVRAAAGCCGGAAPRGAAPPRSRRLCVAATAPYDCGRAPRLALVPRGRPIAPPRRPRGAPPSTAAASPPTPPPPPPPGPRRPGLGAGAAPRVGGARARFVYFYDLVDWHIRADAAGSIAPGHLDQGPIGSIARGKGSHGIITREVAPAADHLLTLWG